ncbi:hypothetical protein MRX96_012096 [Rhipicephalus microplus]
MTHVEAWGAEYGALDEYIFELPGPGDVWQEQQNAILWSTNSREESPHGDIAMQLFNNNPPAGDHGSKYIEPCPIKFVTDRAPPEGSFVCAVAVFRESESRRENVLRCPAHRTPEDALDAGARVDQWFHCDHPQAQNCCDDANGGRYCVRLPLGTEPFSLTFGCRNSCPGGLRRRATEMVFLLQSPEGLDLARSVVQVKVCACPGRDRRHDEQQGEERERAEQAARAALPSTSMHRDTDGSSSDSGGEGRGGALLLRVKGREMYKFLYKLHKSLEISHATNTSESDD